MYIDKLEDKIDIEMYERINKKLKMEIKELEDRILKLKNIDTNKEIDLISRDLIIRLIDHIEIHKDKVVDIYFNFCNH